MGQQQLLLIILGVIVVGIAVAVGITLFGDNAQSANRDAVTNDLVHLASRAQQYYRRPVQMDGGGGAFDGLTLAKLTWKPNNSNGTYALTSGASGQGPVILTGTGKELGFDGANRVTVQMTVWPDSAMITGSTN
jgi:hypothetical protein